MAGCLRSASEVAAGQMGIFLWSLLCWGTHIIMTKGCAVIQASTFVSTEIGTGSLAVKRAHSLLQFN